MTPSEAPTTGRARIGSPISAAIGSATSASIPAATRAGTPAATKVAIPGRPVDGASRRTAGPAIGTHQGASHPPRRVVT
jgi:hypothetical protein